MKNAFYAQSGGVTAVINASACGVIETARKHKGKIGKVYAGRNGIIGALTEDLIDTSKESAKAIAALRHTPAGAFGSAPAGAATTCCTTCCTITGATGPPCTASISASSSGNCGW